LVGDLAERPSSTGDRYGHLAPGIADGLAEGLGAAFASSDGEPDNNVKAIRGKSAYAGRRMTRRDLSLWLTTVVALVLAAGLLALSALLDAPWP
jgi:hypothetical protein